MSYMPRPTNMQSRVSSIRSDIRESGGKVQSLLDFTDGLHSSTILMHLGEILGVPVYTHRVASKPSRAKSRRAIG